MYSFARDGMIPGHRWLAKVSPTTKVPTNALVVACSIPLLICIMIYFGSEQLLTQVTSFAILGIYVSFQAVVLAALRQRLKGWKPAGPFSLGSAGFIVNVLALAYGLFAMYLLAKPGTSATSSPTGWFLSDLAIIAGSGALYLFIAQPDKKSDAPPGMRSRSPNDFAGCTPKRNPRASGAPGFTAAGAPSAPGTPRSATRVHRGNQQPPPNKPD